MGVELAMRLFIFYSLETVVDFASKFIFRLSDGAEPGVRLFILYI